MKTKWFIFALSASTILETRAQDVATNALDSLSASNATRLTIEQWSNPTQPFDPAAATMRAQQTNQSSQAAIEAAELVAAAAAQRRVPLHEEIELVADGAIARFGPHHVIFVRT